jgi:hypothetical protein
MNVVRGIVHNGLVKPSVPVGWQDGTEVLVVFDAVTRPCSPVPSVSASWLVEIDGKVSVGGDAVVDSEHYDE